MVNSLNPSKNPGSGVINPALPMIKNVEEYPRFSKEEIEKFCWMAVHEHKHGVLPTEYDIREIDEDLYLELLREFKSNIY